MYDDAQRLTSSQLLVKNVDDKSWSAVFLTMNASVNNYAKDTLYLRELANQLTNNSVTKLEGTSRLIIWDRIVSGDILFEGKGLVFENDLFQVAGRANQILQLLTNKNFGFITIRTTAKELEELQTTWLSFLSGHDVEEYRSPAYKNAQIQEITGLVAANALIISLQDNPRKQQIIKRCLRSVYDLSEMPKEKDSQAQFCNPDTYTYSYLNLLFGYGKVDGDRGAKWWLDFWNNNRAKLVWDEEKGVYKVKN
jgi:hypothetical protein